MKLFSIFATMFLQPNQKYIYILILAESFRCIFLGVSLIDVMILRGQTMGLHRDMSYGKYLFSSSFLLELILPFYYA